MPGPLSDPASGCTNPGARRSGKPARNDGASRPESRLNDPFPIIYYTTTYLTP